MTETLTMTSPSPLDTPAAPRGVRRVLMDSGYNLTAFAIGLLALVVVITLVALGFGLLVIVGGVLVLSLGAVVARGFATLERQRLRGMLGNDAPSPRYLRSQPGDGFWRRALTPVRDPQSWLDVVWSLVSWITGTFAFSLAVLWWAGTLTGLTYWLWQRWLPDNDEATGLAELLGFGDGAFADSLLNLALGVVFLVTLPVVMRFGATVHASLASVLLCSRAALQEEVARVEGGRDAARMAEAESLRRLERDIHDGPQQRLVRLTMDLGRAKRQVAEDPEQAASRIEDALAQARETVAELRSLSRGIAPPLLVDRGLRAALEEMTTQSVVPVATRVEVSDDLPPHVETAVYFLVSEALTNIAKHSGAAAADVAVVEHEGAISMRIEDDGVGGAHPAKGRGLAGLEQRLRAVDGTLAVDSPEGGPTVLTAEIPVSRP